ncbi:MAG: capping complex subunit for YIEGIA [Halanaerobiales bacterium]
MIDNISSTDSILAIVTIRDNKEYVYGGVPIFLAETEEEMEEMAMLLSRILLAMVHDIGKNIKIIVKH